MNHSGELKKILERYEKRDGLAVSQKYEIGSAEVSNRVRVFWNTLFETIRQKCNSSFSRLTLIEVGCGTGGNLAKLLNAGFEPMHLVGNELIADRINSARKLLPLSVRLLPGDACALPFEPHSFDIVFQSTVFSSILSNEFQKRLAQKMWEWIKPGGGILWYDFIYNNPWNPDVRGVPVRIVRRLFPEGDLSYKRLTLAPPLARFVTGIHPVLYSFFNAFPFLRTHILGWVQKPLR